jgi:hypothetical protein
MNRRRPVVIRGHANLQYRGVQGSLRLAELLPFGLALLIVLILWFVARL